MSTAIDLTAVERDNLLAAALVHAADAMRDAPEKFEMARYYFGADDEAFEEAEKAARDAREALDALAALGFGEVA